MPTPRDRLRELLDAALDEDNPTLASMASDASVSPFHFARQVSSSTGEGPVALRRRVLLERAAWQVQRGVGVGEAALVAGYDSVEGFSRAFRAAFGTAPSRFGPDTAVRLPAPNGIHFHPPMALWVDRGDRRGSPAADLMIEHDVADVTGLLKAAGGLPMTLLSQPLWPGHVVCEWDGVEESVLAVLGALVWTRRVWLAAIDGEDQPERPSPTTVAEIATDHERSSARWLATIRRIDREGRWDDRLIDALCEPPQSFGMAGVVAHVLTYSAHRRQVVRSMLRRLGRPIDTGDPLEWLAHPAGPSPDPLSEPTPPPASEGTL